MMTTLRGEERPESLAAFHRFSRIIQDDERDLEELLAEAVEVLASAWAEPGGGMARIEAGGVARATSTFETMPGLAAVEVGRGIRILAGCLRLGPPQNRWLSPTEEEVFLAAAGERIHAALHRRRMLEAARSGDPRILDYLLEAPIGMALVGPDHQLLRVNRALGRILDYSEEELLGRSIVDITHPDDITKDVDQVDRLFRKEIFSYRMEKRYIRKDGRVLWGLLAATILRDAGGRPLAVVGMLEDITLSKRIEELVGASGGDAGSEEPAPMPESRPPEGSETILVVEDDPVVRRFVSQILLAGGYRVMQARDGREALRFCEEVGRPLDLLLTDVVMAGLSGRDIAERLRPHHPEMDVLYISGFPESVLAAKGMVESGAELLDKPFTVPQLLRRVRKVLDRGTGPAGA